MEVIDPLDFRYGHHQIPDGQTEWEQISSDVYSGGQTLMKLFMSYGTGHLWDLKTKNSLWSPSDKLSTASPGLAHLA
jgi:hypothetical protein